MPSPSLKLPKVVTASTDKEVNALVGKLRQIVKHALILVLTRDSAGLDDALARITASDRNNPNFGNCLLNALLYSAMDTGKLLLYMEYDEVVKTMQDLACLYAAIDEHGAEALTHILAPDSTSN